MSKRKTDKHPLPNPLGLELKRQRPANAPGFDPTDDSGRDAALAFSKKHELLFSDLLAAIDLYILAGDGDGLLLMDGALLGACQRIRDHIGRSKVTVQ